MWSSRIRNVLADDGLTSFGTAWRVGAAVAFIVGGVAVAVGMVTRSHWLRPTVFVLIAWTVTWWLIRGIGILLDSNHDAGFKAIHTALMLTSLAIAGWALVWHRRASFA